MNTALPLEIFSPSHIVFGGEISNNIADGMMELMC